MRCPTLNDLPSPPPGKTGWPWTEESPQLPDQMPDGNPWPRISIVTPSYNQGQFIEETIRSVLLQRYPDLEYIVIDGGSTDDSVEIIGKYEPWLAYWVSEKDRGQANAINKGFRKISGDIIGWLNSDDYYTSGGLQIVAINYITQETQILLNGATYFIGLGKDRDGVWKSGRVELLPLLFHWKLYKTGPIAIPCQPSVFFSKELIRNIGILRTDLHLAMDYEYWLRAMKAGYSFRYIEFVLSFYRFHEESKSSRGWETFEPEWRWVSDEYISKLSFKEKIRTRFWLGKTLWLIYRNRIRNNSEMIISECLNSKNNRKKTLIILSKIILTDICILRTRFFWGAIRRVILNLKYTG